MAEEQEQGVRMIEINDDLPGKIEALRAEGWELIAGIPPVAIYHVVRKKIVQPSDEGAQLTMAIDDAKIGVIRNGKLVFGNE